MLGRRDFLAGATGAAMLGAGDPVQDGFTHGVASGEPSQTSVLLWTRFVGAAKRARLVVRVSARPDLSDPVFVGPAWAEAGRDFTARVTAAGLAPDRWWFYGFEAADGRRSDVGRTRTLPRGETEAFRLGVFSCANLRFGWFHAYGDAAASDIDLAVHLGDYIYEYDARTYPGPDQGVAGRRLEPAHETVTLADYRLRYACYRRDPDLRRLHARAPMIATPDDHEFADNAWTDGAFNHDPEQQGAWRARRAAALQAWREWMPVSDRPWAMYAIGDLAALFKLETRVTGRTAEPDLYALWDQRDGLEDAVARFRDRDWDTEANRIIGLDQERWLTRNLARQVRRTRWQLALSGTPMGWRYLPPEAADWVSQGTAAAQREVELLLAYGRAGVPLNMDDWGGRPRQRARLLAAAQRAGARLIALSGDTHNAYAYLLAHKGQAVAAEFGAPSVTSPGLEQWFPQASPAAIAAGLVRASPELQWCDASRRGWMTLDLTRDEATATWRMVSSVASPTPLGVENVKGVLDWKSDRPSILFS